LLRAWEGVVTNDLFAVRFEAVRRRFAAKLDGRIGEIEATLPKLSDETALELMAVAHRRAHDMCGVGPTMGFVATGKAARSIEQLLLAPLKAERPLTEDEIAELRQGLTVLRAAAKAEIAAPVGQE
jgi:HPt (histidine-containing phosphotransfer) domain-containing protein